ncbi:PEP-CTERM sorting domain-containing protein [Roseateles amylovorans]|uniref:PEP-CTERM sorting domain-containing protein n=1 Tax=Roseateles amylovorans TaxID=2978473 RepID=A0ABY6AWB4_9BURK|nr:PEP-CTERM sorting domain-containing protein [Roseateles amylovorans]UXH77461.1 PEP-CTERM sorting domain-containing protein [Roseateles amylovorans]
MKRVLTACLWLLSAGLAQAQPQQSQSQQISAGSLMDSRQSANGAELSSHLSQSGQDPTGGAYTVGADATSAITAGTLRGSVHASFDGTASSHATVTAQQWDTLTFNGGTQGDTLLVHYSIVVVGSAAIDVQPTLTLPGVPNDAGFSRWQIAHNLGQGWASAESTTVVGYDGTKTVTNSRNQSGTNEQVYGRMDFVGTVTSGDPTSFYMYLMAETSLNLYGAHTRGNGGVDLSQSVYWGGISEVTTWDGQVVPYSVASQSGANYALSFGPASTAPEPSTVVLMLLGALVLGWRVRRRH